MEPNVTTFAGAESAAAVLQMHPAPPSASESNEPAGAGETAVLLLGMALSLAGVAANAVVGLALRGARTRVPWLRALLVSLCAADALLGTASLVLLGVHLHETGGSHEQHIGLPGHRAEYCATAVFRYLWDAATSANLLTLLTMSAHLLVAVRWPHHFAAAGGSCGRGGERCASASAIVAWLASAAIAFAPAVVVAASVEHENLEIWRQRSTTRFCYQLVLYARRLDAGTDAAGGDGAYKYAFGQEEHDRAYIALGAAVTSFVFVSLSSVYTYIFVVVDRRRRRRAKQRHGSAAAAAEEGRLVIVASLVTVLFVVCYLPLYVLHVLGSFYGQRRHDRGAYAFLMAVMALAPVVDPLLYALRLREIRSSLRRLLSPLWRRSSIRLRPPPSTPLPLPGGGAGGEAGIGASASMRLAAGGAGTVRPLSCHELIEARRLEAARPAAIASSFLGSARYDRTNDATARDLTVDTMALTKSNSSLARREQERIAV